MQQTVRLTKKYPPGEVYGSVSQMRRAAMSIVSNIAEGNRKSSRREYIKFLGIAYSSCGELEAQLLSSFDARWIDSSDLARMEKLTDDVSALLWRLRESLRQP
jgi:four helix bundle protein